MSVKLVTSAISVILITLLGVLALYTSGAGQFLDYRFGDIAMKSRGVRESRTNVVYLRIDRSTIEKIGHLPWDNRTANGVLEAIEKFGPKRAVVASSPELVFENPESISRNWLLIPFCGSDKEKKVADSKKSIQVTVPDTDGVVRHLYSKDPTAQCKGSAWEYDLLGVPADQEKLLVNFVGPPNSISNLSLFDVVTGAAPKDFLRDSYVVIGIDLPGITKTLSTPVTATNEFMSEPEFHAHALITLIEGSRIKYIDWKVASLLFLLIICVLWLAFLPSTFRKNLLIASLFAFVLGIVSLIFFLGLNLIMPVSGFAFTILLTFILSSEQKNKILQDKIRRIMNESSWELVLHPGTNDVKAMSEEEIWSRMVGFASIHLKPESMALAVPLSSSKGTRIRFSSYYNMNEADIREKRRDISRMPYASFISRPDVVRVDRYMTDESGVVSFLVPLYYPSTFMGMWLINFKREDRIVEERMNFLLMVGQQVARLMFDSKAAFKNNNDGRAKYSSDWLEKQVVQVDRIVSHLIKEKRVYQSVLNGLAEAVAFTDMFGRVIHMSGSMKAILDDCGMQTRERNTLSSILSELGASGNEGVSSSMLSLAEDKTEHVFEFKGYKFILRILYVESQSEHPFPEGMLLLALNKDGSALPLPCSNRQTDKDDESERG